MMERLIETHKGGIVNDALTIRAMGKVTSGGAESHYKIDGPYERVQNVGEIPAFHAWRSDLRFQNGDPRHGINGITNETLFAILEDRLAAFQAGPFPCLSNEQALLCVRTGLAALKARTAERIARGVEGEAKP